MRRFDTPYIADWIATTLRWMVLVGLLISLSLNSELNTLPLSLLVVMLGWNLLNSILAALNIRLQKNHRQVVFAVDFLLAATFYWVQSGQGSTAAWASLMPILTGAVYF